MTQTKRFSLRTVLTVTTGRLLTAPTEDGGNGIGDLYEILGWITMESSPNTQKERHPRGVSDDPRHPAAQACGAT